MFSPQCPDRLWGPPSVLCNWYGGGGLFRPGCEANHSPPSNAEFENGGATLPLPHNLHGIVLNYLSTRPTIHFTSRSGVCYIHSFTTTIVFARNCVVMSITIHCIHQRYKPTPLQTSWIKMKDNGITYGPVFLTSKRTQN
jgi:hypothetical protein